MIINAKGKVCLVHDEAFEAVPVWVAYDIDAKKMKIIFDTGTDYPMDWMATDEVNYYLTKIRKILLIRIENEKVIEGYDTSFVKYRNGKYYEEPAEAG
ncbi:MAG: hypothetical protein WDO70_02145 [Alphaproteobacteria bacterium]